jgi:hypothetical protein
VGEFLSTFRIMDEDRREDFFSKGYKKRYFFPHEIYYFPRCAMDGFYFANRMWGINNPNSLWEIILYARQTLIVEFPEELFFDEDIIWHQEHLGKPGQIAAANLIIDGDKLYTLEHISDLVQRIHLRKEYRTRINSCFRHWHHMLLNSVLNFAVENSLKYIYSPTANLLVEKYYPKVDRRLFDRIYDRDVTMHFEVTQRNGMWIIDVDKNRHKLVVPKIEEKIVKDEKKTICVFHDIERGLGQVEVDPDLTELADNEAAANLQKMLSIEKELNVKTTYNVVGIFLDDVKASLKQDGHCIAFHSYDHQISRQPVTNYMGEGAILKLITELGYKVTYHVNKVRSKLCLTPVSYQPMSKICRNALNKLRKILSLPLIVNQLAECQSVDYRIKGYRPYHNKPTSKISDRDLCYFNFEWTTIDEKTTGAKPTLENRIVKIPVFCDGHEMYHHNVPYETWENKVVERIKQSRFVAVGLNDCYAHYWLPHYSKFLERINTLGQLKTFNEVANQVFLANAI